MMLEAKNIHKSFGKLHVLKGVNMRIEKQEIVAIVGKSGAGKSTLLHILGSLDTADQGEIYIEGKGMHLLSRSALSKFRNEKLGFIFQFHHLLNEFTAQENVAIPAFIKHVSKPKAMDRAKELLGYLGLSDRLTHKPSELSGGEQQRVAVARALMNQPAIIFADEPTGNLDSETSGEIHQLILQLRRDFQQTFVIVTHNQELARLSDRRLQMLDGLFIDQ